MNVGSGLWYQMDLTSATRATNSSSLWAMQITKLLASFLKPFPLRFSHCTLWSCPLTDTAATTWWARWWWRWRAWTSPTQRAALSRWSERSPRGKHCCQGWRCELLSSRDITAHGQSKRCRLCSDTNEMRKSQERQASKPRERRTSGLSLSPGDKIWSANFQLSKSDPLTFNSERSLKIWRSWSAWCKPDHSCGAESKKPPKNGHHRPLRWEENTWCHLGVKVQHLAVGLFIPEFDQANCQA